MSMVCRHEFRRVGQVTIAAQAAVKLLQTRGIASTSNLGGVIHPEPGG